MNGPLEITFRDIPKVPEMEELIRQKIAKLEEVHRITSCRVVIEQPQRHQKSGSPYRVRLDITVPAGHELVVRREPGEGEMHTSLSAVVRAAFDAARRQLRELAMRQRGEVKHHAEPAVQAVIDRVFLEEGYGFIRDVDQREIYFNRSSLTNADLDEVSPGTPVRFVEEESVSGHRASTVELLGTARRTAP